MFNNLPAVFAEGLPNSINSLNSTSTINAVDKFFSDSKNVISVLFGFSAIVLLVFFIINIVFAILCYKLAHKKGYTGYFFTGMFLGFLGFLYVIGLPDKSKL